MTADPEELIDKFEAALVAAEARTDPEAVELRAHVQPLVDEYRGRVVLAPDERAVHAAWLTALLERLGAEVRGILGEVGGTLQDIDHQAAVDRFLGRRQ
jgi:hypothetical protein